LKRAQFGQFVHCETTPIGTAIPAGSKGPGAAFGTGVSGKKFKGRV